MSYPRDWHPDDERMQRVADEASFNRNKTHDLAGVYDRLQESHRIIAELRDLLSSHLDADPDLNSEDYLDNLTDTTRDAIAKYKHITGE